MMMIPSGGMKVGGQHSSPKRVFRPRPMAIIREWGGDGTGDEEVGSGEGIVRVVDVERAAGLGAITHDRRRGRGARARGSLFSLARHYAFRGSGMKTAMGEGGR
jgi:hypothetical protein